MPLWQGFYSSLSLSYLTLYCRREIWESTAFQNWHCFLVDSCREKKAAEEERLHDISLLTTSRLSMWRCMLRCRCRRLYLRSPPLHWQEAGQCRAARARRSKCDIVATQWSQQRCRSGRMFPGFRSAENSDMVMSQIIDYCNYCNYCAYFHYFRSEPTMASVRSFGWPNEQRSQVRYGNWAPPTVRYCVTAGSATSRWKTLLAELGEALGRLLLAWETRSWCVMMTLIDE